MRKVDVATRERQNRAVKLRGLGANYDQIAETLGYSDKSGARKAVMAGLDRATVETVNEMRVLMTERLDMMVMRCLEAFLQGDLTQVRNIVMIEKRRADLWGLDAVRTVQVTGVDGRAIETDVGQLLLSRLQALSPATGDSDIQGAIEVTSVE